MKVTAKVSATIRTARSSSLAQEIGRIRKELSRLPSPGSRFFYSFSVHLTRMALLSEWLELELRLQRVNSR